MKVEGRGQACPSVTGWGCVPDPSLGGLPSSQVSSLLLKEWFQGSSAETVGGSRALCAFLSSPPLSPSALSPALAGAGMGLAEIHTASHCWVPLACSRPQKPQKTTPLWSREMFEILILFHRRWTLGPGMQRLAPALLEQSLLHSLPAQPRCGTAGQRVTCSEPAAPA